MNEVTNMGFYQCLIEKIDREIISDNESSICNLFKTPLSNFLLKALWFSYRILDEESKRKLMK